MGAKIRRRILRWSAVLVISAVACEAGLRFLIFSGFFPTNPFRDPALYFNYYSDDQFWELNYFTGHRYGLTLPTPSAPLIGWACCSFNRFTFEHYDSGRLGGRRPVLLYGDSFAECTTKRCFQSYFNEDRRFARKCYFLNYGAGGHGIDQTYLTFHQSIGKYRNPLVVYSLLTDDLDRATLRVFSRPKPYYVLDGGRLVLKGIPVPRDPIAFFEAHPPKVWSYLYLLLKRHGRRRQAFASDEAHRQRVRELGRPILKQAIAELRARKLDFLFLIFSKRKDFLEPEDQDWRIEMVVSLLKEEKVPYVLAKNLLRPDIARGVRLDELFRSDGHPSDEQNRIIFRELRKRLPACY